MKKFIAIIAVVVTVFVSLLAMVGCVEATNLDIDDPNFAKYDENTVVEGSAYDLFIESYNNWVKDTNYVRDERFTFQANNGTVATRDTHLIRKVVDDKIYSQEIIYGTKLDSGSCSKKYYFDGANAYYTNNTTKRDITFDKDTNTLTTKDWGDFKAFEGDVERENYFMKEQITTYDFSKRDYLSPKHDDKIYKVGDTYYFSITFDCTHEMMTTIQKVALEDFLNQTGAKEEGFAIENDAVTIDFAVKEIDGLKKITMWRRTEIYSGYHASVGIKVSCKQTCLSKYTYGNAEITAEDLDGLNK